MKTSQKIPQPQYQVCRVCGYDRNQNTATHCEACKLSLKRRTISGAIANVPALLRGSSGRVTTFVLLFMLIAGASIYWGRKGQSDRYDERDSDRSTKLLPHPASSLKLQIIYNSLREVPNVPSGLFNYGGALLFAPLRSPTVLKAITQSQPQFQLRYIEPLTGPGSRKGVGMLLDGQLAFSQAAQPVKEEEYALARGRGFKLQEVPVAIDEVVFFVHPKLNLSGLSVDQLRDIYTGKLKNWKQLGGPDLKIIPITLNPLDSSTMRMLTEDLPGGIKNVRALAVRDYTESIRLTSANVGGISYGSASTVMGQKSIRPLPLAKESSKNYVAPFTNQGKLNTKAVINNSYPLSRRITIVIRRDGTTDELAGVAYANLLRSKQGQKIVEQQGFVPLF